MTTPTQRIALNAETQTKLNDAIHRAIGWEVPPSNSKFWIREKDGEQQVLHWSDRPNYFSNDLPIKHRLEMLGCLAEGQEQELFNALWRDKRNEFKLSDSISSVMTNLPKFLLRLDQPTLALKVCEIKGWV
jgi:hypothetical protein